MPPAGAGAELMAGIVAGASARLQDERSDAAKARRELGYAPVVGFDAGMTALRAIVVDDEPLARDELVFLLGGLENEVEFPPGHLGEHLATVSPVRVTSTAIRSPSSRRRTRAWVSSSSCKEE